MCLIVTCRWVCSVLSVTRALFVIYLYLIWAVLGLDYGLGACSGVNWVDSPPRCLCVEEVGVYLFLPPVGIQKGCSRV
jgi:uncharacterized membrane protein